MEISNNPGVPPPGGTGQTSGGFDSRVGREQFMQLLLAQLRNQNPLEPLKEGEFMGQLAQFSMLEGIENLNSTFTSMLTLQQLTQGANLIGKTVSFETEEGVQRGIVESVAMENGQVFLQVDGQQVRLDQIRTVEQTPGK